LGLTPAALPFLCKKEQTPLHTAPQGDVLIQRLLYILLQHHGLAGDPCEYSRGLLLLATPALPRRHGAGCVRAGWGLVLLVTAAIPTTTFTAVLALSTTRRSSPSLSTCAGC
jgi:hypothetical protein